MKILDAILAKRPMPEAALEKAAEAVGASDWRHSIVDLLKALHVDSSLTTRHQLAEELGYTGALVNSTALNEWLHKEVMAKLAEHVAPAESAKPAKPAGPPPKTR